jgi:D-alanyl-D-alanine carboxypeptidase (penicillin-binding protein 5/6)
MKKIVAFICLILFCFNISVEAVSLPKVTAQGGILVDLNSGKILLEKNSHNRYAPASTTKIMTALITLEKCNLSDKVLIGKNPAFEDGSKIYVLDGEILTVEQLLYALLLPSANDAALALAEHISGSKEAFAKLMNARAKELGCKDTNFLNPNGLYDKNHYTSAYDLSLIASKAMEIPKFRQIVSTLSYNIMPSNKQAETRYLHNENKLLFSKAYKYPGADGVKTGYTVKSKHTYVGSATRNGRTLLVVFLYDDKVFYQESASLFNYGFNNFNDLKILSKNIIVKNIRLKGSSQDIPVYPEKDLSFTIANGIKPVINKKIVVKDALTKVTKGEIVGTIEVSSLDNNKAVINLISGVNYSSPIYNIIPKANGLVKKTFSLSNTKYLFFSVLLIFLGRGFYKKYKRKRKFF